MLRRAPRRSTPGSVHWVARRSSTPESAHRQLRPTPVVGPPSWRPRSTWPPTPRRVLLMLRRRSTGAHRRRSSTIVRRVRRRRRTTTWTTGRGSASHASIPHADRRWSTGCRSSIRPTETAPAETAPHRGWGIGAHRGSPAETCSGRRASSASDVHLPILPAHRTHHSRTTGRRRHRGRQRSTWCRRHVRFHRGTVRRHVRWRSALLLRPRSAHRVHRAHLRCAGPEKEKISSVNRTFTSAHQNCDDHVLVRTKFKAENIIEKDSYRAALLLLHLCCASP